MPITAIIHELTHVVWHFFFAHEFPALFLLVLIEEAGVPIPVPGDTLVAFAGMRHHQTLGYVAAVLFTSSAAVFLGSSALYWIMRRGGRPFLEKYGKYIHLSQKRLERMEQWFNRRGPLAIVYGRLIPGLRVPTTIMAGLSGVRYSVYAPTAAVAAVIWSAVYFWLGALLQHHQAALTSFALGLLDALSPWALACILVTLPLAVGGGWYARHTMKSKPEVRIAADAQGINKASIRHHAAERDR